jgi:2-oxoglutarate dehydrogenase E2 component (dihydrolipoamide succinyltransferase)
VRRLLAERGLEASEVRGTGQGGRITVEDVLAHDAANGAPRTVHAASSTTTGTAGATRLHATSVAPAAGASVLHAAGVTPATDAASGAVVGTAGPAASHRVTHTATRKRIAEHMVQSLLHTAPHVTTVFEADLTAVLEHRLKNKDDFARRGAPLTLTAYFLQATVAAIRAVPEANSRWTDSALEVFDSIHVGVATALDTGLVVPVLRDVQSRDLFETAQGLEDLVSRAREGRLSPADVRGGTFTVSNHGVSGSLVATPIIINQPQSAILGVGKLEKRPVVVSDNEEDRIVIRPRCYVTLTIDHRAMDGHQANRFLQTFVERLATSHL